jgi:hypothetical protein
LCLDEIDANFGSNTRDAIAAFEASKKPALVARANKQLEAKESGVLLGVGPCKEPFKNAFERFRYGDQNQNYKIPFPDDVQTLVNTLEFAGATFTDPKPQTFNSMLRDAIGQVQRQMGLEQTKQVTKEFLDKLPRP